MASKGGASARKPGKYFIIRSVSTNHVLSVLGGYGIAGARVVSNPNQDIDDSKLWYEDAISGTIRSKLPSDLVLHCSEYGTLMINTYQLGNDNQQWRTSGSRLQHCLRSTKVLAVKEGTADIEMADTSSSANQQWQFDHLTTENYFYLKSALHGLVLEAGAAPGAALTVVKVKDNSSRQQWWEDGKGTIRARGTDLVFTFNEDFNMVMTTYDSEITPGFTYSGGMIHNLRTHHHHFVVDIPASKRNPGTVLIMHQMHGGPNQKWKMVAA